MSLSSNDTSGYSSPSKISTIDIGISTFSNHSGRTPNFFSTDLETVKVKIMCKYYVKLEAYRYILRQNCFLEHIILPARNILIQSLDLRTRHFVSSHYTYFLEHTR